jgi:hypothetical protein
MYMEICKLNWLHGAAWVAFVNTLIYLLSNYLLICEFIASRRQMLHLCTMESNSRLEMPCLRHRFEFWYVQTLIEMRNFMKTSYWVKWLHDVPRKLSFFCSGTSCTLCFRLQMKGRTSPRKATWKFREQIWCYKTYQMEMIGTVQNKCTIVVRI